MSVLIKGMEMPKNCDECFILHGCKLWMSMTVRQRIECKHPDCPVIEIKTPHGRLIDADAPLEKMSKMMQEPDYQHEGENWMAGLIMARDAIDEAKTIIEAEEDE